MIFDIFLGMQENIFGTVKPIEDLISFSYSRSAKTISPTEIQNLFHPIANSDTKLFKCKKHIKLESERKWEFVKGYLVLYSHSSSSYSFFSFFFPIAFFYFDSFFFLVNNSFVKEMGFRQRVFSLILTSFLHNSFSSGLSFMFVFFFVFLLLIYY